MNGNFTVTKTCIKYISTYNSYLASRDKTGNLHTYVWFAKMCSINNLTVKFAPSIIYSHKVT